MKKVVLSLAVLFSVAMVACNGNKKAETTVDSDSIIAAETVEVVDSTGDSAAAAAVEAVTPADSAAAPAAEAAEAPAAEPAAK